MELINSLPIMERIKLHDLFKGVQTASSDMEEYLTEQRFSGGRVCPICGGTHVQRNGKRKNGAQKFICKDCGKTFSIRKNTIFNGTRKSLSVWREYMSCMAEGLVNAFMSYPSFVLNSQYSTHNTQLIIHQSLINANDSL